MSEWRRLKCSTLRRWMDIDGQFECVIRHGRLDNITRVMRREVVPIDVGAVSQDYHRSRLESPFPQIALEISSKRSAMCPFGVILPSGPSICPSVLRFVLICLSCRSQSVTCKLNNYIMCLGVILPSGPMSFADSVVHICLSCQRRVCHGSRASLVNVM